MNIYFKRLITITIILFSINLLISCSSKNNLVKKEKLIILHEKKPDIGLYFNILLKEIAEKKFVAYSKDIIKSMVFDFKEQLIKGDINSLHTTFLSKLISDALRKKMKDKPQFSVLNDEEKREAAYKEFYIESIDEYSPLYIKNIGGFCDVDIIITGVIEEKQPGSKILINNKIFNTGDGSLLSQFKYEISKRDLISQLDLLDTWNKIIVKRRDINTGKVKLYFKYTQEIELPDEAKHNIIQKTPLTEGDFTCDPFLELPSRYRAIFKSLTWPIDIEIAIDQDKYSDINLEYTKEGRFSWSTMILVVDKNYDKGEHKITVKFNEVIPKIDMEDLVNRAIEKSWIITLEPDIDNHIIIEYKTQSDKLAEISISGAWNEVGKFFDPKEKKMVILEKALNVREIITD